MNFNTAFDLLMNRLGNRTDPNLRASMVIEAVHVQQGILERDPFKPWFLRRESESYFTTSGVAAFTMPTDFLDFDPEEQEEYIQAEDTTQPFPWIRMERQPANYLAQKFEGEAIGKPTAFSLGMDGIMSFRPVPDAAYALRLEYYGQESQLPEDSATTNNWLRHASEWFLGELGLIMSTQYLQDDNLGQTFAQQALRGKQRLQHLDTAKREALVFRSMGDD